MLAILSLNMVGADQKAIFVPIKKQGRCKPIGKVSVVIIFAVGALYHFRLDAQYFLRSEIEIGRGTLVHPVFIFFFNINNLLWLMLAWLE